MSTKRTRRPSMPDITAAQAEDLLGRYATADARQEEITAKMDQQIARIREKYADNLTALSEEKEEVLAQLQYFSETNRQLFDKKRSLEMAHGKIGFRLGTPKLKPLKGFTWASITNLLKEFLPDYIRTKEEADKEKLIADREKEAVSERLPKVGIECVQDETFFVELKKEEAAAA